MPIPTKEKTWQFRVNETTNTTLDTTFALKSALTGFTTNPWKVLGSGDGTVGQLDGVDRWESVADLSCSYWIVLHQPSLLPNFQMLLACDDFNAAKLSITISLSGGFVGGNGETPPKAFDEIEIFRKRDWAGGATAISRVLHTMQSADGEIAHVVVCIRGESVAWLSFAKVSDPVKGFTENVVWTGHARPFNTLSVDHLHRNVSMSARHKNRVFGCYLTGEGFGDALLTETFSEGPNALSGEWPMLPIGIASNEAGTQGRHGRFADLFWGANAHMTGTTYLGPGKTRDWVQFGDVIFPWNGEPVKVS